MKKSVKIINKSKGVAEMLLYGDISQWDISAKLVSEQLKTIDSKVTELEVRLSSGGGDVFEGVAIYNRLKQSDMTVKVYVDGIAASIASIIMLAGDEIIMGEGAQVMIHKPFTFAMGNTNDLQNTIDRLDRVEGEMVKIYERATGLSQTEIMDMLDKETWFTDDESIEYGFASSIAKDDYSMKFAASVNPSSVVKHCDWIKRKELAKKNTEFKNNINDNVSKFKDILARK